MLSTPIYKYWNRYRQQKSKIFALQGNIKSDTWGVSAKNQMQMQQTCLLVHEKQEQLCWLEIQLKWETQQKGCGKWVKHGPDNNWIRTPNSSIHRHFLQWKYLQRNLCFYSLRKLRPTWIPLTSALHLVFILLRSHWQEKPQKYLSERFCCRSISRKHQVLSHAACQTLGTVTLEHEFKVKCHIPWQMSMHTSCRRVPVFFHKNTQNKKVLEGTLSEGNVNTASPCELAWSLQNAEYIQQ